MKKIITAVLGMMMLGGCKMKEFSSSPLYTGNEVKFTGAVEDRVNLWPVAYYREPVGSLAWPLISWGDDHLALRPFYSQYKQSGVELRDRPEEIELVVVVTALLVLRVERTERKVVVTP